MSTVKFDINRDLTLPYFCEDCLLGKREEEMSKMDIRYCLECQPIIEQEYSLSGKRKNREVYKLT